MRGQSVAGENRLSPFRRRWAGLRALRTLAWVLPGTVGIACAVDIAAFRCDEGGACSHQGENGRCEPSGYCSFVDESCAATGRRYGLHASTELSHSCVVSSAATVERGMFIDPLAWQGEHAAVLPQSGAAAVWWDADWWHVRTDTVPEALRGRAFVHVRRGEEDWHGGVAVDDDRCGGDGSPGIGIMHLEGTGVAGARLRNPGLITAREPLVVEMYASGFVTTGHWWEVAITPAPVALGAEHTALYEGPSSTTEARNIALRGTTDEPCVAGQGERGWEAALTVTHVGADGGRQQTNGFTEAVHPEQADELVFWRFSFWPDSVLVARARHGETAEPLVQMPIDIPWGAVFVHFIAVARDAGSHPQVGDGIDCGEGLGATRELRWRRIRVKPVAFARTRALPGVAAARASGWMSYDLRDTLHTGEVAARPQANELTYSASSATLCGDQASEGCVHPVQKTTLYVDLPQRVIGDLTSASLVYDIRGGGVARVSVNGEAATSGGASHGVMLGPQSVPDAADSQWVARSHPLDIGALHLGSNEITLELVGNLQLERLHLELGSGTP